MGIPPFNTYLGTQIRSKGDGRAEMVLELAPHHLNRRGVAHGGVVSALLDSALGAAVISSIPEHWWCATTSLSTQFIDGAGTGELIATGTVLRRGARVAFASGEVRAGDGRLIATGTGTWHLWNRKPGLRREPTKDKLPMVDGTQVAVRKIVAVGRNYAEHVAEMDAPTGEPPVIFFKPTTALLHDGDVVHIPADAGEVHHEVELVVVIGKAGRRIAAERALDHVLGYAVGLDLTLRDVQKRAKQRGEPWSVSKGFDGSAPVSSIVARDQVGDAAGLAITLEINGECRQSGSTAEMLYSVPRLIAEVSRWIRLEPGDLLFTGTPAGVGPIRPGDTLVANIEQVGTLTVSVAAEPD